MPNLLNVAAICQNTRALGPGNRSVVWVQGCPFHCPGCIAPDWIEIRPAALISIDRLAEQILLQPDVTGITLSGGEPMLQAGVLAALVRLVKDSRDVDVICFTGYRIEQLVKAPPSPGVETLLQELDVLIDGPYIRRLNNNRGLRGSINQRIHHLTDRLKFFDFENTARAADIRVRDGHAMMVGIPTLSMLDSFANVIAQVTPPPEGGGIYERA